MTPDAGVPDLDHGAMASVARLRSRFRGALLGLALGEALAAPVQFARPGTFSPVRDLIGGGPFDLAPGSWTDDTSMALILARSVLERGCCDAEDQRQRFRRWQRDGEGSLSGECLGITASVSRALVEGEPSIELADGADALVRIAPLVMWHYADAQRLLVDLEPMVRVTCRQEATLSAVSAFARMLHAAFRGAPFDTVPSVESGASACVALDVVQESISGAKNWKEAVLRAVNRGGDADVYGAATGQLAGAVIGVESIPSRWHAVLEGRPMI